MKKGIVVLGMHRGGTSLAADLLQTWGAFAGSEDQLLPADRNNPRGYWEYVPLIEFNQELLASVGANWVVPPTIRDQHRLRGKGSLPALGHRATRLLQSMQDEGRSWVWKDPRLALVLSFWKKLWGEVVYLVVLRHPSDIAQSLRKRNHFPVSASLLLWQQYMLAILRETEDCAAKIFIQYEDFIDSPLKQCQRLGSFLAQHCEPPGENDGAVERMARRIEPALRHHQSVADFPGTPQATAEQKALYAYLSSKVEDPAAAFDAAKFPPYAGWREYLQSVDALRNFWLQFQGREHLVLAELPPAYRETFGL